MKVIKKTFIWGLQLVMLIDKFVIHDADTMSH